MKGLVALLAIAVVVLILLGVQWANYQSARERADEEGTVVTFEQCIIDRGPFWYYGQRTPVFYATFDDGRRAYLASTLFGIEIKYVND